MRKAGTGWLFRLLALACLLISPAAVSASDEVSWTSPVGVSVSGNNLTKTAADGWDAGAASQNVIPGGYGYMEFTATETTTLRMAGLSFGNSDAGYGDIDFAIYLSSNSELFVYEAGSSRGQFGTYATGDHLRVELWHGVVRYRKNGLVLYTSNWEPPHYPLRVDTSLYTQGAASRRRAHGQPRVDENEVGVVSGASLAKTGTAGWNSRGQLGEHGRVGRRLRGVHRRRDQRGPHRWPRQRRRRSGRFGRGLRRPSQGRCHVGSWWGGVSKGNFGSYAATDRFRIESQAGSILYFRGGVLAYTSLTTPTYPLRANAAFDTAGGTADDVLFGGLVWTNRPGVTAGERASRRPGLRGGTPAPPPRTRSPPATGTSSSPRWRPTNAPAGRPLEGGSPSSELDDIDFAIISCRARSRCMEARRRPGQLRLLRLGRPLPGGGPGRGHPVPPERRRALQSAVAPGSTRCRRKPPLLHGGDALDVAWAGLSGRTRTG